MTGFQLLDGRHHLFILEGLRDEAVKHIWESVTKPKEGNNIWYCICCHRVTMCHNPYSSNLPAILQCFKHEQGIESNPEPNLGEVVGA